MRVLLAPDSFKGSLSAAGVAQALARGLHAADPDLEVDLLPVADGGEGTLDAALAAGLQRVPVRASGPTGEPVTTAFARRGREALVELADACGLGRLPDGPAPLTASSAGAGQVLAAALDAGCDRLVLGVGGSASTDGGAGLLTALGARLLDADGRPLPPGGAALRDLARLDLDALRVPPDLVVACDVDNPLLGEQGAAAVYGPQKGASPADVAVLEQGLERWAEVVAATTGRDRRDEPGAGAAGGVGFAAVALLGARLRPGVELLLELVRFAERVRGATAVVVGEGSLDAQTLRGKAPLGVARAAAGARVLAVCGRRDLTDDELRAAGVERAWALTDLEPDPARCVADPVPLLERTGALLAAHLGASTT